MPSCASSRLPYRGCAGLTFNGNAGYQTVGTWQGPGGLQGLLQRNVSTGLMSISLVNTTFRGALADLTDARVVVTGLNVAGVTGTVVRGSSPGCPVRYVIITANSQKTNWSNPMGDCLSEFDYHVTSTGVLLVQRGARDPMVYAYNQDRVVGPVAMSVAMAQGRGASPRPAARTVVQQQPAPRLAAARPSQSPLRSATPGPAVATAAMPALTQPAQAIVPPPAEAPRALERVGADQLPAQAPEQPARAHQWVPQFDPQ